jgi:hypothetical protein
MGKGNIRSIARAKDNAIGFVPSLAIIIEPIGFLGACINHTFDTAKDFMNVAQWLPAFSQQRKRTMRMKLMLLQGSFVWTASSNSRTS